jgi:hypothetical protein
VRERSWEVMQSRPVVEPDGEVVRDVVVGGAAVERRWRLRWWRGREERGWRGRARRSTA